VNGASVTDDQPLLIVLAGPSRGSTTAVDRPVTIGRDQASTLCIHDLTLSRHHCRIEAENGELILRDLDSRNGTLVNGLPVRTHRLMDGDEIRAGASALLFVSGTARDADDDHGPHPPVVAAASTVAPLPTVQTDTGTRPLQLTTSVAIEHSLVGDSPPIQEVLHRIARVAPTDATVLIRGESGTGKELVARAIQVNSARASGPFVPINCAALPEGLLESELFGHEKGAFTGAVAQKRGRLELASGGTVFFDEIGELAPSLQAKLLRVLQERELERVGGTRALAVDLRVVAATNRDLEAAVKAGSFRQDLYFRLNVVSIAVPPLRERRLDVSLLVQYFVNKYAARCGRRIRGVTREARACLLRYDWPGNVRELENAIEHAVVLGTGDTIGIEDLPEHLLEEPMSGRDAAGGYHAGVNAAKRTLIECAIERAGGNYAQAARQLALQPTYLHRLIRKLGVRKPG
jgi:transcriptional regulator with GAF, ATPase, and Fis domain